METVRVRMIWNKETKNTHRYMVRDEDEAAGVREIYVQKAHLKGSTPPKEVFVTVERAE